jgi:hypothetical protein
MWLSTFILTYFSICLFRTARRFYVDSYSRLSEDYNDQGSYNETIEPESLTLDEPDLALLESCIEDLVTAFGDLEIKIEEKEKHRSGSNWLRASRLMQSSLRHESWYLKGVYVSNDF